MRLRALSLSLLLLSAQPGDAQVTYGGGHRAPVPAPAPAGLHAQPPPSAAATAHQTHRRHHHKAAHERAAARLARRAEQASSALFGPGGSGGGMQPIVGNATSTSTSPASSTSPARKGFGGPAYEGPLPPGTGAGGEAEQGKEGKEKAPLDKRGLQVLGWSLKGLKKNGVAFGFLPDDGSGGGQAETIEMIQSKLGVKAAAQGWYAQVLPDKPFDGAQFEARKDQIRNSDGVFQATVMPVTWKGFTWEDNSQAINVANYLQKWIDAGKEVWLRFAHEVNYYQRDGTYQGTVDDFKLGWAVMAKARDDLAPNVKMWFTPNMAHIDDQTPRSLVEYDRYYPEDPSTVDVIGIDWYPHKTSGFDFANGEADMKPFHDKY
ncbi:hypothetical protein JCM10207_004799 [Rhodosporidiobolus poonsookiae]